MRDQEPTCPVFTRAKIKSRFGILDKLPSHTSKVAQNLGALSVTVIILGNDTSDTSLDPEQMCLRFISDLCF